MIPDLRTLKDYRPQHDEDCRFFKCRICDDGPRGLLHGNHSMWPDREHDYSPHSECSCGLDALLSGVEGTRRQHEAHDPLCSEGEYRGDQVMDCDCAGLIGQTIPTVEGTEPRLNKECHGKENPGCHDTSKGWCHHFVLLPDESCDCGITTKIAHDIRVGCADAAAQRSEHETPERSAKDIPHSAPEVEQAKEAVLEAIDERFTPDRESDPEGVAADWHYIQTRLDRLIAACDARIEMEREEARLHTRVAFDELENAKREIAQLEQRLALLSRASQPSVAVEQAKDEVLKWLDKAFWGRTDAQVASQWEHATKALDALIAAVSADASRESQQRIEALEKRVAILTLAIPLEDELASRIDEMLKHLAQEQGFTLNGIARLLIDTQRRMAADWSEVGNLRRELKQAESLRADASRELQPIPSEWGEAANAARGLCESEARKWETQSPKTAEHWHRVAVHLGALYLTQDHLARADASREKDEKKLGAGLDVGESTESGEKMRNGQRGDHT